MSKDPWRRSGNPTRKVSNRMKLKSAEPKLNIYLAGIAKLAKTAGSTREGERWMHSEKKSERERERKKTVIFHHFMD